MKYRDLYSKDFLRQFKDYELAVGDIELEDDKFSIDVLKIVEVCDIPVEYDIVIHSGWSYFDRNSERKIVVNFSEPEYRQRFTLAHELGHAILHPDINTIDQNYKPVIADCKIEMQAEILRMSIDLCK